MSATVKVELTRAEAEALWVLIGEGREGILTDDSQIQGYLGGQKGFDAAVRACHKFQAALDAAKREGKGK